MHGVSAIRPSKPQYFTVPGTCRTRIIITTRHNNYSIHTCHLCMYVSVYDVRMYVCMLYAILLSVPMYIYIYIYIYNHAHRPHLEKLLYLELSRSTNGFFKVLLDPGGQVKRPLRNRFGSETVTSL